MKLPLAQSDVPGAKTLRNCPWWVRFRPDQGQKPHKSAPGGHVSGLTRGKNPAELPQLGKTTALTSQARPNSTKPPPVG